MKRREFLTLLAGSVLAASCGRDLQQLRIGLALGGGGARGLAHIPMLEVFDELKIRPYRIAGCSIGAVMGGLYASGLSGSEIRASIDKLTVSADESWLTSLFSEDVLNWFRFFEPSLGKGGLVEPDALIDYLLELMQVTRFRELKIPLTIVATDFWNRRQVLFDSGELGLPLKATIAIPGLFNPVEYEDKLLVDGGLVNPVPYDVLFDDCDVVVAVDVLGVRTPAVENHVSYFETTFNTFQIMQAAIMHEKQRRQAPDIYVKPELRNIRVLEFYKAGEIYRQSDSAQRKLYRKLKKYRR